MMEFLFLSFKWMALSWVITSWIDVVGYSFYKPILKFNCIKCICFWTVLIFTFNPFLASVSALMAYSLDKFLLTTQTRL